jgi:lysylphosphatidylglycerol synthetase-like protein (DUF2156 family)
MKEAFLFSCKIFSIDVRFENMTTLKEKTFGLEDSIEGLDSIVKRLGSPASTILLDFPCHIFRLSGVDGIIGYQLIKNCAVVIGDPICLAENAGKLSQAFLQFCRQQNWTVIYILASNSFAHWALKAGYRTIIEVGEELMIDPTKFMLRQKLRWKINQSIRQGVVVKEYKGLNPALENQMKETLQTWLKNRHNPQVYLGDLKAFLSGTNKRIFYAVYKDQIIGLLKITPIDRFEGWTLSCFLALAGSPIGTSEHLMNFVFETLAQESCHFLCLGATSGSHLGEIVGMNAFSKWMAHFIFNISRWFFKLDAKRKYLSKYQPHLSPDYFVLSGKLTFAELMAIKQILHVKLCFR